MPDREEIFLCIRRAQETYSVACELHQNHHYNDAISRAYYSMFYAAKAVLLTKDIITKTHRGTISELNKNFVREGEFEEDVWKYLPLTETLREEADYSIIKKITQEESQEILEGAHIFIQQCESLVSKKFHGYYLS